MVKKFILLVENDQPDQSSIDGTHNIYFLLNLNDRLSQTITRYKNMITQYHNNKSWDKFKKLSNEYEMIFTTPNTGTNISEYTPVSRSFFKLWEMLHDFDTVIFRNGESNIRCLFLAEGPGGFAEALVKYRHNKNMLNDQYYGISLRSNNDKNIPEWKLQKGIMKHVKIIYGEDNTGNLYNINNIEYLRKNLGDHSLDFITADGGFDFSSNFNNQEDISFRLIFCEVLAALMLQKDGGTFILKVFDIFSENTLKLLQLISCFYAKIYIVKPLTSRPANSEKYLICTGFHMYDKSILVKMTQVVREYNDSTLSAFIKSINYDERVLSCLIAFNTSYIIRQVFYIEQTITYINRFSSKSDEEMTRILNDHARKSKKWCSKYNISQMTNVTPSFD